MNFPVMKALEIKPRFDISYPRFVPGKGSVPMLGDCYFYQEVEGVVDAVKWVYRAGYLPAFGWMNDYWACYSLGVDLIHIVYGSQIRDSDLQYVDAKWKKLAEDPYAAAEEALEEGKNVSNSFDKSEETQNGNGEVHPQTGYAKLVPDIGFPTAPGICFTRNGI